MSLASRIRDGLTPALRSLASHRVRSALTTLGLVVGVASVVLVTQVMKSLEARILAEVERGGSGNLRLDPWTSVAEWRKGRKVRFQPLTREVMQELREAVPEIRTTSGQYFMGGKKAMLVTGRASRRVVMHAVDEHGLELLGLDLAAGRGFTPTDRITRAPVIILGAGLAEEMELTEASLGRTLTLGGQTAELVGILRRRGDIPFTPKGDGDALFGQDTECLVPFGSFRALATTRTFNYLTWTLAMDGSLAPRAAEARVREALRRIRGLSGDDPDNFNLTTNLKEVEMVEKLTRTLLLGSAAMISISLLVGGIGVMNIMLVTVTERTREIGLRKALGARRRAVLVQFLVEAVILGLLGGALGLALGLVLGSALSAWLMDRVALAPPWALGSALAVPALLGIAFGTYPALRASKLDPVEALRWE